MGHVTDLRSPPVYEHIHLTSGILPRTLPSPSIRLVLTDVSSVADVDAAMRFMDSNYDTQFHCWIRNEKNVSYIAYYLRKLIVDFEETNMRSVHRAIQWLVHDWSVQRTAELLVKLFYHWGIDCPRFGLLIAEVMFEWNINHTTELVTTLVIGERSSKVAQFINHLTNGWCDSAVVELVRSISTRLQWSERYFKHFILQYVAVYYSGDMMQYQARRLFMQQHTTCLGGEPSVPGLSLVEFSIKILQKILSRTFVTLGTPFFYAEHLITGAPKHAHINQHPLLERLGLFHPITRTLNLIPIDRINDCVHLFLIPRQVQLAPSRPDRR
ncbi:hypothetical protein K493DRAFT_363296 [Basidiobolus meristosporus CBS 931.73]|uniref:Uncharacterized protein n=1 Tax=Basidiobolus meristosporus CBS 931.73 TaxID=1314790 RepID=A0A1Y1WVZ9_9FUNG|nr:hypothetical protein K493DRAFT_363296 [Basidiobolus meristosporus CBS 931.73]|eukprot:ORX77488.1 hypothetical protein K493DRAFT_363296 [Basidiobolus meristosporus CBS 931.73]